VASRAVSFRIAQRLTAGPDPSPTPFRPGEYSPAAAVAKLTASIMAGARDRALQGVALDRAAQDKRYRDLQMQLLEQRIATPPEPRYSVDIEAPGSIAGSERGPNAPNLPPVHIEGLTPAERAHIALGAAKPEMTPGERERLDLSRQRFALQQRVAEALMARRRNAPSPDMGPRAGRVLEDIDAEQKQREQSFGNRISLMVSSAISDLRKPRSERAHRYFGKQAEEFVGLTYKKGTGKFYGPAGEVGTSDFDRITKGIVDRFMARRRLTIEQQLAPRRARLRQLLEDAALGPQSDEERYLQAIAAGPPEE